MPPAPPRTRGFALFPVEGDRWIATVGGVHGDHPPTTPEDLDAYAASIPGVDVPALFDAYDRVSDEVAHYPFPSTVRRRYAALERFPAGLVVIGDALASFNPMYGQGMSVAALEARLLHDCLATTGRGALGPRLFERADPVLDAAWALAVGPDHRFPRTTGPRPRGTRLVNRYVARLHRTAHTDRTVRDAFTRVVMLERPPSTLFHPGVAWRVLNPWP